MAFRLEEDLLDLKEPPICFLDMRGLKIRTEEELQFAIKRVPDLKLRKEKIIDEEIVPPPPPVLKKKTGFNNTPLPGGGGSEKKGDTSGPGLYDFENPIPDGMRGLKLRDVAQVEIDWKMLTLDRPKTQLDEEIYSRFVSYINLYRLINFFFLKRGIAKTIHNQHQPPGKGKMSYLKFTL